jgi:threonine/homoserine/homoserine lactone efflux protein
MDQTLLSGLALFALVSTITPGPNNMMLIASGANFGFRRSVPHILGICVGFVVMIVLVGLGLMQAFAAFPVLHDILTVVGVAYLVWLAWKIAHADMPGTHDGRGRPLTFMQAALFQWVNPKAWQMGLTAITLYAPDRNWQAIALVAAVFGVINLPSVSTWTILGQQLRRVLSNRRRLQVFNWSMAALLLASLIPVLWPTQS